jgi:hypothetical protein
MEVTLYLFMNGEEGIYLRRIIPASNGGLQGNRCDPRWFELENQGDDLPFVVASRIIASGEIRQRNRTAEIKQKRSRNLLTDVESTFVYLARTLPRITDEDGGVQLNIEEAQELLVGALVPVKEKLGMPKINPVEESYEITEEVLDAAKSVKSRTMLTREIPHGIIFPERAKLIEDRFTLELGDDAAPILQALWDTENRRHIALMTLGGGRSGEPRVSIVDEAKNRLEMPDWKLLDLLNHSNQARRIYTFPANHLMDKYPEVIFNSSSVGDLVAKYRPEESVLEVINVIPPKQKGAKLDKQGGIVKFYLDQDYLACLWIVLSRIASDLRRYNDLFKVVEAQLDYDPLG